MVRIGFARRLYLRLLSILDVLGLFTECVEIFEIVVITRDFDREFVLFCIKVWLHLGLI
jgi:hypothetical protein